MVRIKAGLECERSKGSAKRVNSAGKRALVERIASMLLGDSDSKLEKTCPVGVVPVPTLFIRIVRWMLPSS